MTTKLTLPSGEVIDVPEFVRVPGKYAVEFPLPEGIPGTIKQTWVLSEHHQTVFYGVLYKINAPEDVKRALLKEARVQLWHMDRELLTCPLWALQRFNMPVQLLTQAPLALALVHPVLPHSTEASVKFFVVVSESREEGVQAHVQQFVDADEEITLLSQQWRVLE